MKSGPMKHEDLTRTYWSYAGATRTGATREGAEMRGARLRVEEVREEAAMLESLRGGASRCESGFGFGFGLGSAVGVGLGPGSGTGSRSESLRGGAGRGGVTVGRTRLSAVAWGPGARRPSAVA